MNKEFIPYEEALALKELGFDEPCFGYYKDGRMSGVSKWDRKDWEFHVLTNKEITNLTSEIILAPTYSQAFRWFREKYVLLGFIEPANGYEDKSLFAFYICDDEQNIVDDSHSYSKDSSLHFKTYEEAELACLIKLIEIVKEK
jgi:hypothetical protein